MKTIFLLAFTAALALGQGAPSQETPSPSAQVADGVLQASSSETGSGQGRMRGPRDGARGPRDGARGPRDGARGPRGPRGAGGPGGPGGGQEVLSESPAAQTLALAADAQPLAPVCGVKEIAGITYVKRGDYACHMNLFLPESASAATPCVVYVPGSAFRKQNLASGASLARLLAGQGIAVAVVEYRGSETAPFPAQTQDAKTAVRYVRRYAGELNVDPDSLFLLGNSSGGHTALMAGITAEGCPAELDTEAYSDTPCGVKAIFDFYGPTDFTAMNKKYSWQNHSEPTSPEGAVLGGIEVLDHPELAARANPAAYVAAERACPPILIFHGTRDGTVSILCSDILADALRACGKNFAYYVIPDAGHGGPQFESPEVLKILLDWIRR